MKIIEIRFNPCFYWILIFTQKSTSFYDKKIEHCFNPCFYWILIFTALRVKPYKKNRQVSILVFTGF